MTPVPEFDPAARRSEIGTDSARIVLGAAARRLIQAYDDYEDALDRGVTLAELQLFDQEVARAEREHQAVVSSQARP